MKLFNNREIAAAFWGIIFLAWILPKKEVRESLLRLVKAFFKLKIVLPFILLLTYSFLTVFFLRKVHIWELSNLKETIYWFFFSGMIIAFRSVANEAEEKPIRKIIKELIAVTIILEFIVNTYVFKLPIELIFVPTIAVLTAIYTYASFNKEYKIVEKIFGTLIAMIGIAILAHALIQIYHDFNKFARLDTFIDFIIPPILTISILPAIYLLLLYTSYEDLFIRVGILLDSKEKKRYAKKLLVFHCGFKVGKVRGIQKFRVGRLYSSASKEEIRTILLQDEIVSAN